jgi:hypothetical protein
MMTSSHRSDQSSSRGRSPQHINPACDLSTPEVPSRSLARSGARDIHLISFCVEPGTLAEFLFSRLIGLSGLWNSRHCCYPVWANPAVK